VPVQRRQLCSVQSAALQSDAVTEHFLRRIEKLALTLLGRQFQSPDSLWQFQLDLLNLQRDIQAAINDYKGRAKRDKDAKGALANLRACRWHARRLGDAFAWVVLGGDGKLLEPLSRNNRTAIARENHGSRGMILAARYLASQGQGFPLLHDITDLLRIGDITLVRVGDNSERTLNTVEVKTRAHLKRRLDTQDLAEYEYHIEILSAGLFNGAKDDILTPESTELVQNVSAPARPIDKRLGRQAKRMSTALLHQASQPNVLIEEEGETPALWAAVNEPVTTHWKSLQRVVRKARRSGYGAECVDDTFLYVALYDAEGLSPKSINHSSRLRDDLSNPRLLVEDDRNINVLSIALIPPPEVTGAQLFRPFYLYPIPRSSIRDLLHGRMIILVCLNEGRLVKALEEADFSVDFRPDRRRSPLIATGSVAMDEGTEFHVQLPDLRHHLDQVIYEFRGRDAIVQAARVMFKAAAGVVADSKSITPRLVR
jgi:hypothetical protein